MPKTPTGGRRPADTIKNAVFVMRLATGEAQESEPKTRRAEGGKVGGKKRAANLSPEKRSEIAKKGAATRWKGKGG